MEALARSFFEELLVIRNERKGFAVMEADLEGFFAFSTAE